MIRFYGAATMAAFAKFTAMAGHLLADLSGAGDDPSGLRKAVDELAEQVKDVPLSLSLKEQIRRFQADLNPKSPIQLTGRERLFLVRELHNNLLQELAQHLYLLVSAEHKWMFLEPERWFGEQMATRFSDALIDMRDAAKCFALSQWTATVFHAMRVLEHGLRALAARLNVTFTVPIELEQWRNIIDRIEKEIRQQEAQPKSTERSKELQFCAECASHFWYFKEAWRNHVSHSRVNYDPAQAERVLWHVRDFMRALAA